MSPKPRSEPLVVHTKPGLTLAAAIEPLLSIRDLAEILNVSRRVVEGLRSNGRLPKPDLTIGKMPRWKAATIRAWIERGSHQ
jgi:predicted DNA-binding transcriptional regulator AlpA